MLVPCPKCARHVRPNEKSCAFCNAEIATSRALKVAVAALVAASAIACQKEIAQPYGVPINVNDGRDAAANPVPPPADADAGAPK
jgi:hypothetical protein